MNKIKPKIKYKYPPFLIFINLKKPHIKVVKNQWHQSEPGSLLPPYFSNQFILVLKKSSATN